ncbi:MAG TPA: SBBP repeat-containing protein, partial [Bryobacteraceae bacterium]|nr:SBBP repeat-containing protein [Bryobacteraceae bacterium]
ILIICSRIALSASHASATYLDLKDGASPIVFNTDAGGNVYGVYNATSPTGEFRVRIIKSNSQGDTLLSTDLDPNIRINIVGVAADGNGNVVVAGNVSTTQNLPLVSPLFRATAGPAFVMKFDPSLQKALFSTLVGGPSATSYAQGLYLDTSGNIFLTGSTVDPQFPVTPGAYQQPPQDFLDDAFLMEISSAGTQLIFSTHFGGEFGVDSTMGSAGTVIRIDSVGDVILAGITREPGLPLTAGSFSPTCGNCHAHLGAGFLAKFDPHGKLLWVSYIPVSATATVSTIVSALTVASDNSILVGGGTSHGFPVTPGALQTTFPQPSGTAGFVIRVSPDGAQLQWATYFGGGGSSSVNGIVIDSANEIWISGTSLLAASLPASKSTPVFGTPYVAGLSADGSTLIDFFSTPEGGAGLGIGITTDDRKLSVGAAGGILSVAPGAGPSLLGIVNSAATHVSTTVAPGELVSLYGIGIGPAVPVSAKLTDGAAPNVLSGVQVVFDGAAAGMLYAGPNQINAVVNNPTGAEGQDTAPDRASIQVITPNGVIDGIHMSNRFGAPQVFQSTLEHNSGLAAAMNQDGSVNSKSNPAAPGSIVAVWVSGCGSYGCSIVLNSPNSAEVVYDGQAPGLVNGLFQVNFRLPLISDTTSFGFVVLARDASDDTAASDVRFVYMKPN